MSFIQRFTDSVSQFIEQHPTSIQLTLTAVAASALTASSILTFQANQRKSRARTLKDELKEAELRSTIDLTPVGTVNKLGQPHILPPPTIFDDRLIEEQLSKNTAFLGQKGADKVRDAFVIVVGAGGVGSWAALMLMRSGVKRIRIIDFDQVTLSSLNRHAVATLEDVGTPKVRCIKTHFKQIAPFVQVEDCIDLLNADNVDDLLSGNPDYVIDAIDNINTKIDLIKYCHDKKLPVISSMGAGAKADPSRIQIADISETFEDPLARSVRQRLKKLGILNGVPVAYSTEKPHHVKLLPLEEEKIEDRDEFSALPDFRARILPVLGTIPSMFGMAIATYIILKLADYPDFDPLSVKLRDGLYGRVHKELLNREVKTFKEKVCALDVQDVAYIFEEMWHGKSVVSGPNDKLALTRWDKSKPLSYFNTVCLTRQEANEHDALPENVDLEQHYGKDIYDKVASQFEREKSIQKAWNHVL
ncbi:3-hydroxy-3-methylglutaryl-coenzyme A (HMG-CoA) reductase isozyme [Mucor velutinosus]|uniref:3-hydroxy-3-methylglutaryl-coenzyme A (HMG-CoA) reductase isozyme n=1 Tax=Mucor velutinosus TaxID=708070 RepID=A0AAN7DM13_9FUNG|nr:3-hydroxy-3-methylglutaryl-coenzyme A (HMG-CoA) reductase isozyme [Mucor velutinosus]